MRWLTVAVVAGCVLAGCASPDDTDSAETGKTLEQFAGELRAGSIAMFGAASPPATGGASSP